MSLRRRGGVWHVSVTAPDGRRIRCSAGTPDRVAAQEFHDRLKVELWRIQKLGEKPRRTWKEAVVRYLTEVAHKATIEKDRAHLRRLDCHLGRKYLDEITKDVVDYVTTERVKEKVSPASVNRLLATLRAVLRKACYEWEWIEKVPKVKLLKEPKRRVRFLTREEADRLLAELPPHQAEMARFALATGLRQGNVKGLEWSQVDLEHRRAWVHPDQAKSRKAIPVPLNAESMLVLRRQRGKHERFVFTYQGGPVNQVNTKTWRTALERAGIKNFRWHDLRHCWASWHVQQGTPLHVLQELGGWESTEMVRRYAHLAADHLAEYAEKLAQPRAVKDRGTNSAQ